MTVLHDKCSYTSMFGYKQLLVIHQRYLMPFILLYTFYSQMDLVDPEVLNLLYLLLLH